MDRQLLIDNTIKKIVQLSDNKLIEINDFADFLLGKMDDKIIQEGIQNMISESKTFYFLHDEPDLYSADDLKEKYNE